MFTRTFGPRSKIFLAALMALALLGACGGGDEEDAAGDTETEEAPADDAAAAGTLEFAGTEYAFSVPSTVPAGETSVTLVNKGEEPHMLDFVPLVEDAPPVQKLLKMRQRAEDFFAGRPIHIEPIDPGETSEAVEADLKPGRYAYVCFYSEKGEKPHAVLGMVGELTVE